MKTVTNMATDTLVTIHESQ